MTLFENEDFFKFPSDFDPNITMIIDYQSSLSSSSSSSSSKKRQQGLSTSEETKKCSHCDRYVLYFILNTKCCSYECMFRYYERDPKAYDFCTILFMRHYHGNGEVVPAPRKDSSQSSDDFWELMLKEHYKPNSIRHSELLQEYKSNHFLNDYENELNKKIKK